MLLHTLFVGEAPASLDAAPLTGDTGRRLSSLLGVEDVRSVAAAVNLYGRPTERGDWDETTARNAWSSLDVYSYRYVVLLGRRVQAAAGFPGREQLTVHEIPGSKQRAVLVPHPSGLNRFYNDPDNRRRAAELLRRVIKEGAEDVGSISKDRGDGSDRGLVRHHQPGDGQSRHAGDRGPTVGEDRTPGDRRTLRPHQAAALDYCRGRDGVALFMKMRLGKTLVAIRWAMEDYDGSVLVVAPLSVLHQWEAELALEGLKAVRLLGSSKRKLDSLEESDAGWVLVNPEGLRAADRELFETRDWDTVIVDESTCMANPRAKLTKSLLNPRRWGGVRRRAVLAGEPAPESEEQYFSQMAFVRGDGFMGKPNYWTWRPKYMRPAAFGWELKDGVREKIVEAVAADAFVMDAKAAGFFARRVHEVRKVQLPAELRSQYRKVEKDWAVGDVSTRHSIVAANWLRQLCAGCDFAMTGLSGRDRKHEEIASLLAGELKDDRVIVWYWFKEEAASIAAALGRAGVRHYHIDGDTPAELRAARIEKWKTRTGRPLLLQLACGRFGLTLSAGTAAIYASNDWAWLTREQSVARLDAVGLDRPALILDMVYEDTVDEDVLEVLKEKRGKARDFLRRVMERAQERTR